MSTNDIHGIERGWKVQSADHGDLGTVEEVTDRYILVKSGLVNASHRYLPAATLSHVRPDQKEIEISLRSGEVEEGDWSAPPAEGPRTEGAPLNVDSDEEADEAMQAGTYEGPEHPATF
ncbi:MAG: hypothetical protein K5924_04180 [Chloroflexi bacterium]|nr:hypothetical protein [Chloroflexota bacterium]